MDELQMQIAIRRYKEMIVARDEQIRVLRRQLAEARQQAADTQRLMCSLITPREEN
jgi:hypothetical protein